MLEYLGARGLSAVGLTTIDRARSLKLQNRMRCELSEDGTKVELHWTQPNGKKCCVAQKRRKPGVALRVLRTSDHSNWFIMILHSDFSETLTYWDVQRNRDKPLTYSMIHYHWGNTSKEWETRAGQNNGENKTLSERLKKYQLGSLGRSQCAQYLRMKAKVKTVE
jgi:hypothetical protein